MNKEEFKEMHDEFANYVYQYENFVKAGIINDAFYNQYFFNDALRLHRVEVENNIMISALKRLGEKVDIEDVKKEITANIEKYNNEQKVIEEKKIKAQAIVNVTKNLSKDELMKLENDYLAFVKKNHPAVKCKVDSAEQQAFILIRQMYYENNLGGFYELLDTYKTTFKDVEYDPKEYNSISGYYFEIKANINKDFNIKQKQYPYTKFDVLKDEITIARETGDIRAKINDLKRAHEAVSKDFKNAFGFELTM